MKKNGLETFVTNVTKHWSGLNTETVVAVRQLLVDLTTTPSDETWLNEIVHERPAAKELYRDPQHGFILMAHSEEIGLYRQPHNHGAGWVFYAVYSGEIAMTTYKQITSSRGKTALVSRGSDVIAGKQCRVFLPGDIHDPYCMTEGFVQFRLTSSDFKKEIQEGRMIKFDP